MFEKHHPKGKMYTCDIRMCNRCVFLKNYKAVKRWKVFNSEDTPINKITFYICPDCLRREFR